MDESVLDHEVGDEAANLEHFGATAGPLQPAHIPRSAVYDEYTGDELPPKLVAEAREEEVAAMEEWEVWEEVPEAECWRVTGKRPIGGRWVDHDKGHTHEIL